MNAEGKGTDWAPRPVDEVEEEEEDDDDGDDEEEEEEVEDGV